MESISASEVKTHLTRHGQPAALLVPVLAAGGKLSHSEVVEGMRELRKRAKPGEATEEKPTNEEFFDEYFWRKT